MIFMLGSLEVWLQASNHQSYFQNYSILCWKSSANSSLLYFCNFFALYKNHISCLHL